MTRRDESIVRSADDLIGKTVMYMGKQRNVVTVTRVAGQILIVCENDHHNILIKEQNLSDEIKNMIVVGKMADRQNGIQKYQEAEKQQISDLRDIMLDNIKKVKESKDYIPQAKIITNSVNTLLNMAKLNIDLVKQQQKNREY